MQNPSLRASKTASRPQEAVSVTRPAEPDDAALAAAALRDPAAFAGLYRRYVEKVYRYLYSHVGEATEAEDLTAQVFTAAWEGLGRYRERGNFAAWLFQIARNKTTDAYRRRRPQVSLEAVEAALPGQLRVDWDPLASVEHREALQRLAALVGQLEPEQRELIRLRFAAELSFAEIAALLGRSEGAVKMALHRTLRSLGEKLEVLDA